MGWALGVLGLIVGGVGGAAVIAQTASPDAQSWLDLVQYGILGLVVIGFLTGKIVPGWVHNRVAAERDAALKKVDEQSAEIRSLVMPLLAEVTKTALLSGRGGDQR